MKGQPFEVGCRGGSLLIQESRVVRHGTVAWALWRSQMSGAGCVVGTAGGDHDATVYLHLRDGRRFAVEEVAPRECLRLFELLGYEPEPVAGAGRGQEPVVIDLGDRHTRVVSSAQRMMLEQDGHALLTLPCDQLVGVRVAAREDTAKVQIVTREGFATQLDGVPFGAALRLLVTLGAAPREIEQLARPEAPPKSSDRPNTPPKAAEPVAEPVPPSTSAVPNRPADAPSRATSRRRPIGKGSALAARATVGDAQHHRTRVTAPALDSESASDSSPAAQALQVAPPRQRTSSPGPAAPSGRPSSTNAGPTTNGTSAVERNTTAQAIGSRTLPATRDGGVAVATMATTASRASTPKSEPSKQYPARASRAPSEVADDTAHSGASRAADTASPSSTAAAEVVAPDAPRTAAALETPIEPAVRPTAAPPRRPSASPALAADARTDRLPAQDALPDEQSELPLSTRRPDTRVARGSSATADDSVSVHQAARLLWLAVLAAVALRLAGLRGMLSRVRSRAATSWSALRAHPQAEAEAGVLATERARAWSFTRRFSARARADLRALRSSISALRRPLALVAALAVLAVLALPTAGDALVVRMAASSHRGVATVPAAPRTAALVPTRDPIPRTSAPADAVYAGSQDGAIYALDAHTGALLWRYDTGSPVEGGPVVVDGVIYAGEADGAIVALRAATHHELWSFHTGDSVRGAPVVVDGVVYAGSSDDHLYALRASDGTLLWRFGARDWFASTPAVTGGMVYAGSYDGTLYALRASDGAEVWHLRTRGAVTVAPVIVNGTVYAGSSDDKLYALDARTGAVRWWYTTAGSLYATPVVANSVVYVGSSDSNVYALRASNGTLQWSARVGGLVLIPPVVEGQTVYVTSASGMLYALRASNGALQWRYATPDGSGAPAVMSGTVYVSAGGSSIAALDARDGTLRWSYRTSGHVTSSVIGVSGS